MARSILIQPDFQSRQKMSIFSASTPTKRTKRPVESRAAIAECGGAAEKSPQLQQDLDCTFSNRKEHQRLNLLDALEPQRHEAEMYQDTWLEWRSRSASGNGRLVSDPGNATGLSCYVSKQGRLQCEVSAISSVTLQLP